MSYIIQKAMVIGSGTMGAGIAGHLANAGIPVYLVDIVPDKLTPEEEKQGLRLDDPKVRNRIVDQGLAFLKKSRPPGLFSPTKMELITAGNLEDDFGWAGEADWIIEVVVENLEVKQKVMARIETARKEGCIVSTNTSGIPIHRIAEGRSVEFKAHFLGTHFFNPARYLKLLELIPTPDTDSHLVAFLKGFGERRLGKTAVIAKDTPNFIANRVGVVSGRAALNYALRNNFTIEEVDAVTGTLIGHPKTASFRLMDLVGGDISKHVSGNLYEAISHDPFREQLLGPIKEVTDRMVEQGFLGNKSGQGFYKKVKGADGKKAYQVLDLKTLTYRDQKKTEIKVIGKAKKIRPLGERFRFLVGQEDRYSRLIWHDAAFSFSYCSHMVPEITDALYGIDDAMKAGFLHRKGPFEIWDALGVADTVARMEQEGFSVAPWVKKMLQGGASSFYKKEGNALHYWDPATGSYQPVPVDPYVLLLSDRKAEGGLIKGNQSASLIDLGDGVLCVEFHSKMNSLDPEILNMCDQALEELEKDHIGLVIGNQGSNFCAGADILAIVMAAENKQWDFIDRAIKDMQNQLLRLRYSPKPVVAAPFGMTLGVGVEIAMAADRMCASAESYMGLVQVGVGLVPAGGGCAQMIQRVISPAMKMAHSDPLPFLMKVFETVGMAKISASAAQAREFGFLKESDRLVMNGDHLLKEAKRTVMQMSAAGYAPPARTRSVYALGARGMALLMQGATSMVWSGHISEYDKHIGQKLAYILSGGPLSAPQWVDEQYILDLEREVFLSLCGEEKTLARIKHMLTTGNPLRN